MADSGHPPAELHERLLICRTIKLNAGATEATGAVVMPKCRKTHKTSRK